MKTIIETTHIEFGKSSFLIDLIEHSNKKLYVEIIQVILNSNEKAESIKINPTVLPDIIKVLQDYQNKLPNKSDLELSYISENDQQKIQNNYLKGVPIKDLEMQLGHKRELIEMILRNKGIEIVDNNLPKSRKRYFKKRK